MRQVIGALAAVALLTAPAQAQRVRPSNPVVTPATEWPKYCGTLAMSGMPTGAPAVGAANAGQLALLWKTKVNGPIASAPSVSRGILYIGDWAGIESAIDVESGKVIATADLGHTEAPQCTPSALGITSSPAIDGDLIFLAGGDDAFYALDRQTLAVVWRKSLGDNSAQGGYYGWCSPAVLEGVVLQGIASNCDNPFIPGRLVALNRNTGEEVASATFVPDGTLGNGVWTSPAVDLNNREVFVTTASGLDYFAGMGYSMVRLDLNTLEIEDSWKVGLEDSTFDADWGSSPTLFTDQDGRELVGAGQKDGKYYAFVRSNLSDGPTWTAQVAVSGEVPQDGDGTLSTAAFDGQHLFVGGGTPPNATNDTVHGTVVSLDAANGQILWRRGFPGPVIAPVSTVNGVVFAAGGNLVRAVNATNGQTLWSFRTDAGIYGGIAIAGNTIFVGDLSGNLYAFRVSN